MILLIVQLLTQRNKADKITEDDRNLPEYTMDEFNKRVAGGQLWIIVRDVIYDLQKFGDRHPGICQYYIQNSDTNRQVVKVSLKRISGTTAQCISWPKI